MSVEGIRLLKFGYCDKNADGVWKSELVAVFLFWCALLFYC